MTTLKDAEIKNRLLKLGLKEELIHIFQNFVNKKQQLDAIKIFKKLDISRERVDQKNESNLLIRVDNKSYDVSVEVINNEMFHYCTCPHRTEAKACAHAGAVLIHKMLKNEKNEFNSKTQALQKTQEVDKKNQSGINYFKDLFPKTKEEDKKNIIYFNFEDFDESGQLLKIQRGVMKKDGSHSMPMKFTGKDFNWSRLKVSNRTKELLRFVITGGTLDTGFTSNGFSKSRFYDVNTDLMMPLFKELFFDEQELILGATFAKEPFHIAWEAIKNDDGNYTIRPYFVSGRRKVNLLNMKLTELGLNTLWVFDSKDRCFYGHKEAKNLEVVKNIIRFPKELVLSEKELKEFFSKYYQDILNSFEFNVSEDFRREEKSVLPKPKLYLERAGNSVKINLRFDYAGREVDFFSETKELVIVEKDHIYDISRDIEEEDRVAELLNNNFVVTHDKYDEFTLDNDLIDFVTLVVPKLVKQGIEIMGEESLFNFKVSKAKPTMMMEVRSNVDWFNIKGEVRFGKDKVQMEKVLEAIFKSKRFIDLGDGKRAVIPKEWGKELSGYKGLLEIDGDSAKLSKYHLSVLESLVQLSKKTDMDDKVTQTINKFRSFDKIQPAELSSKVKANLRNYQKTGYDWLNFLVEYDFNGILADDMGLGKTLQALSLLQKIKDGKNKKPFLVIVPTSLVFNWKNEIEKFTPELTTYLHHGPKRIKTEKKFKEMLDTKDIIITTYGTLRNDLDHFASNEFEYLILDEAHIIKNPSSVTAKSVFALKAKNKLVISGTPIQNNLMELWSLFQFLNPGYLGTYDSFKENFVIPIEKDKNEDVTKSLKRIIDPFMLKRNKDVIADELPEKTEMVLRSNFLDEEKEVYDNWKDYYMGEISKSIKDKGFDKTRMKILEGLTKLRQISLHPKMIDKNYKGSSGKFDLLMMEVEKVLSEGHKVLIFSSFVKMLTIVKDEFEERGIKYSYLDGKSKNREEIVEDFEGAEGARPFLISIKAGGVGLNLTSADYVFIVDPWWNPAVEMQAMDRAHRIGQKKPVFVYKMIAEDSIEEKILDLQKSKKKLVENVISVEKGTMKTIDAKTINEIFG